MNIHNTMHWILAWTALSLSQMRVNGVPYGSINDLYDTNYEYEFGDNQVREEVLITKTPQFLSQPQEIVVNEGHTVRLPCLVDRLEGFVLLWRKNEQIISVGHQILDRSESRIQLEEVENGNTLVISLADRADEAEYVCSVSAYRKTEIRHNVRIRVNPVITTSPEEPLTLSEGDSATLSCQLLSGTPIPDLKWRRCEGESFPTGEKEILEDVIKLESVTRDDSGCYVCQADNGFADAPVTSLAMLVVEYPPTVHIQKTEDSAEEITITCTVESQPAAEVTWLKNGEHFENETKNLIISRSGTRNTITLVALDEEDFGNYTCVAENKLGIMEESVNISGKESEGDFYENVEVNAKAYVSPNAYKLGSEEKKLKEHNGKLFTQPYRGLFTKLQSLEETSTLGHSMQASEERKDEGANDFQGQILSHPRLQWNLMTSSYRPTKISEHAIIESPQVDSSVLNIQKFEKEAEFIKEDFSIEEKASKLPQNKKSSGKIYFARIPSLYTLPEQKVEINESPQENAGVLKIQEFEKEAEFIEEEKTSKSPQHKKSSSGKIYFARRPSLYTLPEKKVETFAVKKDSFPQKTPKNVDEFLKLLRIYHDSHAASYKTDSNFNEDKFTEENTTDSQLLRSTHAYNGKLATQLEHEVEGMGSKSEIESESINKFLESGPGNEKGLTEKEEGVINRKTVTIGYNRLIRPNNHILNSSNTDGKSETKSHMKADEIKGVLKEASSDEKESYINGRYLDENEILTNGDITEELTDKEFVYKSKKNPLLRGHHSIQTGLGTMIAKDILLPFSKEHKFSNEIPNTDRDEEKINNTFRKYAQEDRKKSDELSHKSVIEDGLEIEPEKHVESLSIESDIEQISYFPKDVQETGFLGTRYIKNADLKDLKHHNEDKEVVATIPGLRGQHLLQTRLDDVHSDDNSKTSFGSAKKEQLKHSDNENEEAISEEENMNYINMNSDHSKTKQNNFDKHEIEELGSGEEMIYYQPTETETAKQNKIVTGIRYLEEPETGDATDALAEEATETSQVLRGQHSLQATLGTSGQENKAKMNSDLDVNKQSRPFSKKDFNRQNRLKDGASEDLNSLYKPDKEEHIHVAKKMMYPKEIMDIETMYFTRTSDESHPLFLGRKSDEREEWKVIPKPEHLHEEGIDDVTAQETTRNSDESHPLFLNGKSDERKEIPKPEYLHEERIDDGTTQEEATKKFRKNNPLRGDHSYHQALKDIADTQEEDATEPEAKEEEITNRKYGPHPFRGLMFRTL
eukprot:GFUD01000938.1.p1 GENE.GFUD01000938.1~~GFUD01000938.1.p1  ORF type:complete len:1259 (+),score=360.25 GFUD01000938.1:95-3871(+)